jgi:ribonuclease J
MNHPHPNLGTPPALVNGGLRIVALGGLTEIGRNMTVFECSLLIAVSYSPKITSQELI